MPGSAEHGAVFDLGANYYEVGRLAGALAARVLQGTDPATVAIENVMPETLVINRQALPGLKDRWTVPADLAGRARFVGEPAASPTPAATGAAALRPPPGRHFKVGLVYFAPDPGADICMQGLLDGLRALGFVEGENLEIRRAHAQGEIANIPAVLQSVDTQGLDLIVPLTTPCLTAACGMVKHTPVVFTYVYDPIAAGAGKSFTDHHPNVTGVGSFPPVTETVAMIQRVVPGVRTVGTLYNSSEANSRKVVEVARRAFVDRGIRLEEATVVNSSEVFQAAQALVARGVQAFWITGDNTAIQGFDGIVRVATDAHLPIINNDPELVAKGALACVGIGFYQSGYAAATHAARVLLGASPKDVPIENVVDANRVGESRSGPRPRHPAPGRPRRRGRRGPGLHRRAPQECDAGGAHADGRAAIGEDLAHRSPRVREHPGRGRGGARHSRRLEGRGPRRGAGLHAARAQRAGGHADAQHPGGRGAGGRRRPADDAVDARRCRPRCSGRATCRSSSRSSPTPWRPVPGARTRIICPT